MKNLLKTVRDSIAAAMTVRTIEQMETEQRQDAVKAAVDDYLIRHPDWKPTTAPAVASVTSKKQKANRILKSLGAGAVGFQAHVIDPELLEQARAKCRELVAANPELYSHIIQSAPIHNNSGA